MRKDIAICLVTSLLLVAGCGGETTTDADSAALDQNASGDSTQIENGGAAGESSLDSAAPISEACVLFAGDGPDSRFAREDQEALAQAFEDAGLSHRVVNAKGDLARFNELANELIGGNCFVLFMASPDSTTGVAVIAKAQERGIPVVDYENLTLGGGADYYLGFDLVSVGVTQGQAILECLPPKVRKPKLVYLNGSPTDANSTLLKLGYASVLEGVEGKKAGVVIVDDQSVPDWGDENVADIVKLVWARADGKIDGLVAASDSLAIASLSSLPAQNRKLAVVGQGATTAGMQSLIDGKLCASVYKPVRDLARGAAEMATAIRDEGVFETQDTLVDIATSVPIPAKLILARKLAPSGVKEVLSEVGIPASEVCDAERQAACAALGIA